jgi:hypothetical protein
MAEFLLADPGQRDVLAWAGGIERFDDLGELLAGTASWTTWNRSTAIALPGSIRFTAERYIVHMSIATIWTASRHSCVAPVSQYAASSAARPST